MKKYLLSFLVLIAFLVFPAFTISAETSDAPRVLDNASIFTADGAKELNKKLNDVSQKYNVDVAVVTMLNTNEVSSDPYSIDLDYTLEIVHDRTPYADEAVLLGINMDPDNREVIIQAYGECQKYITDGSGQVMIDKMLPDLKSGNYDSAVDMYISLVDESLVLMQESPEEVLPTIEKGNYFIDDANIYTDEEEQQYLEQLKKINNDNNMDLYVLTLDHFDDYYLSDHLDILAANNDLDENVGILAIYLTNTDKEIALQAYGKSAQKSYLTDERCQKITDAMVDYVSLADYTGALDKAMPMMEKDISHKAPPVPLKTALIELLICMVAGLIYILCLIHSASAHNRTTRSTYEEPGSAQILARFDSYTHTTVTKRKIESNSSSSGHSHSGGHSHAGGGGHSHGGSHHSSSRSRF